MMMNEAQIKRLIRQEIERYANVILPGVAGVNEVGTETIEKMFPGSPSIPERPVMHPYGFASRAARGTVSVVARTGEHPGNRMVIGHRDKDRPTDLEEGEAAVYSVAGYRVVCREDRIALESGGTVEVMVLGEALMTFLGQLLDLLAQHTHGSPGAPPSNAMQVTQLKTQEIETKALLASQEGGF